MKISKRGRFVIALAISAILIGLQITQGGRLSIPLVLLVCTALIVTYRGWRGA